MQERVTVRGSRRVVGAALVAVALGGLGCSSELDVGGAAGVAGATGGKDEGAVIVGGVDWQEAGALPDGSAERQNAAAVAYLELPAAGSRCTAFLIAPDVVMTNHHCVPEASAAAGARAFFRYEAGVATDAPFDCSRFLGNDAALDFALLQCSGRPGDTLGVVELDARAAVAGEAVYVLHQNCDYYSDPSCAPTKKLSAGRVRALDAEVSHDADTLGGSSGSPLLSRASHTVIGLHHVGLGGDGNGRGTMNRAVPMTRIVPVLLQRFPGLALNGRAPATPNMPTTTTTDPWEPNDTLGGATAVTAPFTSTGARIDADDRDVFAFVNDGASRSIELTFRHADGDLDLYVYDATGNIVVRSVGVTDREVIAGALPGRPADELRVVVVGYSGATGAYTLTLR